MKYLLIYLTALSLLMNCALADILIAQNDKNVRNVIEDDIDILETILDKMFFKRDVRMSLYGGKTSGHYLDNYGILFKIPYSMNYYYPRSSRLKSIDHFSMDPDKVTRTLTGKTEINNIPDMKLLQDKEIAEIRRTIDRFMSDYLATMNYASSEFWITVFVDIKQDSWLLNIAGADLINQIIARVQIKNINAFRAGKISRDDFIRSINYSYSKNDDDSQKDEIDIFSHIVESYFNSRNNDKIRFSNDTNGFHIDGYGLIFMGNVDMIPNFINIMTEREDNNNVSVHRFTAITDSLFDLEQRLSLLEDEIATLISRYGHTLTSLREHESIEFAFNLNTPVIFESASKVIYRVKKDDIDKYGKHQIDYDEFKRRVEITRYY